MSTASARSATEVTVTRTRIDVAIEFLALLGLILVPLVFRGREWVAFFSQPKFFVLHFVALSITVLWTVELALNSARRRTQRSRPVFELADDWLSEARHRWTLVAVAGFGFAFVVSTLLSPSPWVSVWGRDFGDLGYDLYSTLSYLVIFFAVALRTKTQDQVLRIVLVIVSVGTLSAAYGVSQSFGWDPVGRGENLRRVIASFGNPLFFGAYLVMSVPLVMAVALHQFSIGRRWVLAPGAVSIGLHFAALWYAGGRGAWIASIASILVFVAFAFPWLGRVRAIKAAGLGVIGGIMALIITSLPGGVNETGRGLEHLRDVLSEVVDGVQYIIQGPEEESVQEADLTASVSVAPGDSTAPSAEVDAGVSLAPTPVPSADSPVFHPVGRPPALTLADAAQFEVFGAVDRQSLAIGERADIWRGALKLAVTRDRVEEESGLLRGLRFMFGFGPDMYFYSFPINSRPLPQARTTSHTHNYPLQVLMEQGIAGLALFLATAILVFLTAISVVRSAAKRREEDPWLAILMVGLLAALIARAIEQGPGVGRVSDLVTFWALMGLVIAVAEIEIGPAIRRRADGPLSLSSAGLRRLAPFGAAILVGVVALTIFIQKDVNTLRAGVISARGFEQKNAGENDDAFRSFQRAVSLAPDVERYYTEVSGFLNRTAAAHIADDPERARELYTAARNLLLEYEERDPLAWQTQLGIATATAGLAGLGDESFLPEVVGRYLNIAALMKPFSSIQATAAENIVIAGEYEIGADIAEYAIALEGTTGPVPTAWWALGEAAFQLDRLEDAELAWKTSLKRQGRGVYAARSHRGLAFIAETRGDEELAAEHNNLAGGLELQLR